MKIRSLFSVILIVTLLVSCGRKPLILATRWEPDYKIDRFEESIRKFEERDARGQHPSLPIVLTGSSSFALWKDAEADLAPLPVLNRGFGGSTFPEVLYYLDRSVLKYRPGKIVIYCENDMFGAKPKNPEQTRDDYARVLEKIRKAYPTVPVYYVGMKPSPSRWAKWADVQRANDLIREVIKRDKHQYYIDVSKVMLKNGRPDGSIFQKDSLHMNAEGYRRWTSVLKPILSK